MKTIITAVVLVIFSQYSYCNEAFVISRHQNSNAALQPCVDKVSAAYHFLQINFKIIEYPGRRSLHMANSGKTDAELCRIKQIEKRYTNLILIKPAIHQLAFHAVSKNINKRLANIDDLKGLRIGSIRGMMAAELIFEYRNVRYEKDLEHAARLLENNLADVLILSMPDINYLITNGFFKKEFIHPTPLYQLKLYHYIHQKHKDKQAAFNQAFEEVMR